MSLLTSQQEDTVESHQLRFHCRFLAIFSFLLNGDCKPFRIYDIFFPKSCDVTFNVYDNQRKLIKIILLNFITTSKHLSICGFHHYLAIWVVIIVEKTYQLGMNLKCTEHF